MQAQPRTPQVRDSFCEHFNRPCAVVARAPGRVNLIGEHTDYNDGFVLPMALEHCTWVAAAARDDGRLRALSLDLDDEQTWTLQDWHPDRYPRWTSYVAGVAVLLNSRARRLKGCDLLIHSDVPVGGGLPSSAALEVATAQALLAVTRESMSPPDLADLCRAAEHEYAGVPCGLMDQYVSLLAKPDCALLLDCRARTWQHIPLALGEHIVLVVNSGVRHELATGEYALRQQQCRRAVEYFRRLVPTVQALRDVELETAEAHAARMRPELAARARHVTSENRRTLAAADALRRADLAEFGRLMNASHRSLRDDYQVSCPEVDRLVEIVANVAGVLGTRMTGGGFGGCIVALVRRDCVEQVQAAVHAEYDAAGYGPSQTILSRPGPGASIESA